MKKCLLLIIIILAVSPLYSEDDPLENAPVITISPLEQTGDAALSNPVSETVISTLKLTLQLLGRYRIISVSPGAWSSSRGFSETAEEYSLDNIITGSIEIPEDGGVRISLSVYDRESDKVSTKKEAFSPTFMGIFDTTDQLAIELIEELTQEHLALGSLSLENQGDFRNYQLSIDDRYIGENITELPMLPAGSHSIRIYETVESRELTSVKETITIKEGQSNNFTFSLLSPEQYDRFVNSGTIPVTGASFKASEGSRYPAGPGKTIQLSNFEIQSEPVTNKEFAELIRWSMEIMNGEDLTNDNNAFLDVLEYFYTEKDMEKVRKAVTENLYIEPRKKPSFRIDNDGIYYEDSNIGVHEKVLDFPGKLNYYSVLENWDGQIHIPENKETSAVTNITWYGALLYCNMLSLKEGLDPCYNLADTTCDFSKNGYRLPTEAEYEYASIQKEKDLEEWEYFSFSETAKREWCWDWHRNIVLLKGKEVRDPTGADDGTRGLEKGESGRWKRRPSGSNVRVGFRMVRSLNDQERELNIVSHDSIRRHSITLLANIGVNETGVRTISASANYFISPWRLFSLGVGFGVFFQPQGAGSIASPQLNFIPFIIGSRYNFAIGANLILAPDLLYSDEFGPSIAGGMSLLVFVKGVVIEIGVAFDNPESGNFSPIISMGGGFSFNF